MNDSSKGRPLPSPGDPEKGPDRYQGQGNVLLGTASAAAAFPLAALFLEVSELASNAVLFALVILAAERIHRGLRSSYVNSSTLALLLALVAMATAYNMGLAGSVSLGLDMGVDAEERPIFDGPSAD